MKHKGAWKLLSRLLLSAAIASCLAGCGMKLTRPPSPPTIVCEQPPAPLLEEFPKGDICFGTEEQRRKCYFTLIGRWAVGVQFLYKIEVDKRATEDACMDGHRKTGVIR